MSVDVSDELPWLRLVEVLGQLAEAILTDAEVAQTVIVYTVLADGRAHSADVADEVKIGNLLVGESVTDGAPLLRAGRHTTPHAIQLAAYPAVGAAQSLFLARYTVGLQHFLIGPHKELELVAPETLVLSLHTFDVEVFLGDEGAMAVVLIEGLEGVDVGVAFGGVVGAEEVELYLWESFDKEGLAALERTAINFLASVGHALHAVDLLAGSFAADGLHAHFIADAALVLLTDFCGFEEAGGC